MRLSTLGTAAGAIAAVMLLLAPASASATALTSFAIATPGNAGVVEKVDYHRRKHRDRRRYRRDRDRDHYSRRYDRRRHGRRYRDYRPGFRYHYGGYYYANPWWVAPGFGLSVTVPVHPAPPIHASSAHVEWCLGRFRSYDVASDTYLGYDGYRHRCNSPYR